MKLIKKNYFVNVVLSKIGIKYKIVNGKIKITGIYERIKFEN